jgi:hypothetical protein
MEHGERLGAGAGSLTWRMKFSVVEVPSTMKVLQSASSCRSVYDVTE